MKRLSNLIVGFIFCLFGSNFYAGQYDQESVRPLNMHRSYSNGRTQLHYAAAADLLSLVQFLLIAGVSVDSVDVFGKTPLYYAAYYKRDRIVE